MVGSLSAGLLLADEAGAHLPSVDDFFPRRFCSRELRLPSTAYLIRIVATIVLWWCSA